MLKLLLNKRLYVDITLEHKYILFRFRIERSFFNFFFSFALCVLNGILTPVYSEFR